MQARFATAAGASLGTVRKWVRGERVPFAAARKLVRVMARGPSPLIEAAGLSEPAAKRVA